MDKFNDNFIIDKGKEEYNNRIKVANTDSIGVKNMDSIMYDVCSNDIIINNNSNINNDLHNNINKNIKNDIKDISSDIQDINSFTKDNNNANNKANIKNKIKLKNKKIDKKTYILNKINYIFNMGSL